MKEIHKKGDSLATLRNGSYPGMNTAVLLNHSGVFHANEWKGRHHYPIFPPGYHQPVHNLLPVSSLKELPLGRTDNNWANLNVIYSHQIPVVQILKPSHATITSMKQSVTTSLQDQEQRVSQASTASTANVPQFRPTLTQSYTKDKTVHGSQRAVQSFPSVNPATVNQVDTKTTTRQKRILPRSILDISSSVTQINNKNFGGYMIQNLAGKESNAVNVNPQSNSSVNLTELSSYASYKENPIIQTTQTKQQELLQTRKRSSSWPTGSGLSKKRPKDGLTRDDQTMEEYKNLEMDVARILISDIPFPVVSVGDKCSGVQKSFVRSGGREETERQADTAAVLNGGIVETEKRYGGIQVHCKSGITTALEGGGGKTEEHASLWPGGISGFNSQSSVMSGKDMELEKQESLSQPNGWNGGEPGKQATKSIGKDEALTGSRKEGEIHEANKQTNASTLVSAGVELDKGVNESDVWSEGMVEPNNQEMGEAVETSKQAKESPMLGKGVADSEKQMNKTNAWSSATQEPNKHVNNPAQKSGEGLELQKHLSNSVTEASLHFENEKENFSKNLVPANEIVFTCEQCCEQELTFESIQDLISHTASHTSSNFTFKCNVCTQVFRSTNGLQKHIEFHADHRNNFQCSFCFNPFSDRDSLEEHIIGSHMSKRPHKCSYCPKAFRDPGSLQKHIRIHTGERPYKCTACDKSFAEYSSLRKHYRVHTGEQPYKCQYCPKAFSISGNLQRHILIHTGERPYKCSECNKTFNNPSHLRRHEKNLHSKLEGEK